MYLLVLYFLAWGTKFYLVMLAAVCWAMWTTRNRVTFDKYNLKNPVSIMFTACTLLKNWAGLYADEEKEFIRNGAQQLVQKAMEIVKRSSANEGATPAPTVLRITGS